MRKDLLVSILIVGISLGTAWAIRGHFGHEQGAAWAGAIGALALVLVSGRKDWYQKMFTVALSAAFGWGVTGMISYGMVVGYGRSDNFPNAFYGLLMLFVIGGLFGLLGGGLTGLALESSKEKQVQWPALLTRMTAGGLIAYGFLIWQLEWLMTPPRQESWAICLGASLAMIWYMKQHGFSSSLRVALITGTGAGWGFAFGNFLQTLGTVLAIRFNMWNVMEYSIGFFGGSALAYSIFTSEWPQSLPAEKWENRIAYILVFIFIPFVVFQYSLLPDSLEERFHRFRFAENTEWLAALSSLMSCLVLVIAAAITGLNIRNCRYHFDKKNVLNAFTVLFVAYFAVSYLVNGLAGGEMQLPGHLYVLNLIVVLVLLEKAGSPFAGRLVPEGDSMKLVRLLMLVILIIAVLSLVSILIHGEMPGAHDRFPLSTR